MIKRLIVLRMSSSSSNKNWFKALYGFNEIDDNGANMVKTSMRIENDHLVSNVNGRSFQIGTFSTTSLLQLKEQVSKVIDVSSSSSSSSSSGSSSSSDLVRLPIKYQHIVTGDIFKLHHKYPDALFQAASQFNCLEFATPSAVPEDGIYIYTYDRTQGPACAISCASGTIYRNYFYNGGQSANKQLNTLHNLEQLLFDDDNHYWNIRNGYTYSDQDSLEKLNRKIEQCDKSQLRDSVQIGIHKRVGVMFSDRFTDIADQNVNVTQAYCSAISCAYCPSVRDINAWEPLATLILEAAYEATILSGILNRVELKTDGSKVIFLTLLGGGVFGNKDEWICRGIGRALAIAEKLQQDIQVNICHYSAINDNIVKLIQKFYEEEIIA